MGKVAGNEVRPGMVIELNGSIWTVVKTQSVKPGKGGTYNQVELKNVLAGGKLNERFRASEAVEEVYLEKRDYNYLFTNGDMITFMDVETYEQIEVEADFVGEDRAQFLQDGMKVILQFYNEKPISITIPNSVVMTVTEADGVMKGGTAAPSYKGATLENGMRIQVPPFINVGEKIIVSTEDATYVRRAEQ